MITSQPHEPLHLTLTHRAVMQTHHGVFYMLQSHGWVQHTQSLALGLFPLCKHSLHWTRTSRNLLLHDKAAGCVKVWSDTAAWVLMAHFSSWQLFKQCYDHQLLILCGIIRTGVHFYMEVSLWPDIWELCELMGVFCRISNSPWECRFTGVFSYCMVSRGWIPCSGKIRWPFTVLSGWEKNLARLFFETP